MIENQFRWNKKRKHYAYILKERGEYVENILLTTDQLFRDKKKGKAIVKNNIPLSNHPNPNITNKFGVFFIVNHKPYIDKKDSFDSKVYSKWKWNKNDKRTIKRFKKYKKYKSYFNYYRK